MARSPSPLASQALLKDMWAVEGHRGEGMRAPLCLQEPSCRTRQVDGTGGPK